jgi:putative phosphoribosyl transferase
MPAVPSLPFRDRDEAGHALALAVAAAGEPPGAADALVLALPRGGLPVARQVAQLLGLPLDVLIVRKLGVPGQPEFAMGAIASGGLRVLNDDVVRELDISAASIDAVTRAETAELARRERLYRGDQPAPAIAGRTVIVVDDGLATGATMRAAVRALRTQAPSRIVVAVPVSAADTAEDLRSEADAVVTVATPEPFLAVGRWYRDFDQVDDAEVRRLLTDARAAAAPRTMRPAPPGATPGASPDLRPDALRDALSDVPAEEQPRRSRPERAP